MSSIFVNSYSHKFTPYSVPNLRAWFDARFGVYSALAIPDSSATVNGTGFPVNFSNVGGVVHNGVFGYIQRLTFGKAYGVAKINNKWVYASIYSNYSDDDGTTYGDFIPESPAIEADATEYPWQATWPSGISITRNGTATGTLATYNQKVVRWENRLNTSEAFSQPNISSQPSLLLNQVYFDGNQSLQYIPQNTQSIQWNSITYYLVFRQIDTLSSPGGTIIRASSSTTSRSLHRFAVQISPVPSNRILVNHSNTNYLDSGVTYVDNAGMNNRIYSIEFENTGSRIYAKVYNNIYATPNSIDVGTLATLQTRFLLGASTLTGSQSIYGSFSHVLIYYNKHTEEQRVKIMKYLRDNINNGYATEIEF